MKKVHHLTERHVRNGGDDLSSCEINISFRLKITYNCEL